MMWSATLFTKGNLEVVAPDKAETIFSFKRVRKFANRIIGDSNRRSFAHNCVKPFKERRGTPEAHAPGRLPCLLPFPFRTALAAERSVLLVHYIVKI